MQPGGIPPIGQYWLQK